MKTAREDAKQRICMAARDEFLLSGYANASMRRIASQAGMTVGNIYLYFSSKELLFDAIVGTPVAQLRDLLRLDSLDEENMRFLVESLHAIFIENRVEFLILINKSEGSKYASLKDLIIQTTRQRLDEAYDMRDMHTLCAPIAAALIEGLLCIFDRFDGNEAQLTLDLQGFLNHMLHGLVPRKKTEATP